MFDGRAPALARRTPWAYTVEGARGRGRPRTDRRWNRRRAWSRTAPADRDETARAWGMGSRPTDGRGQADDEADRTGRRESAGHRRRGRSARFETGTKKTPDEA